MGEECGAKIAAFSQSKERRIGGRVRSYRERGEALATAEFLCDD